MALTTAAHICVNEGEEGRKLMITFHASPKEPFALFFFFCF